MSSATLNHVGAQGFTAAKNFIRETTTLQTAQNVRLLFAAHAVISLIPGSVSVPTPSTRFPSERKPGSPSLVQGVEKRSKNLTTTIKFPAITAVFNGAGRVTPHLMKTARGTTKNGTG